MTDRYGLRLGDSREWLAKLKPNSIDALVTDPPAGISFMGKEWDHDHGHRDEWVKAFASIFALALAAMKPGAHGLVWALPRTSHWTATALEDAGFEVRDIVMHLFGTGFPKSLNVSKAIDAAAGAERTVVGERTFSGKAAQDWREKGGDTYNAAAPSAAGLTKTVDVTAPATPEAIRFDGWGTALKPAAEHWILVRKPLSGTVAANVLAHGTGALNIDGCRIATGDNLGGGAYSGGTRAPVTGDDRNAVAAGMYGENGRLDPADFRQPAGRWPANVTLDEEAAEALDAQSGGASRFFYVAKAARSERDAGCDDLPPRSGGQATDREDGSAGLSSPRAGAGRTGGARNHHPTVKSVALMRWLCRLVTPPEGIILDPFMGSGSTGVAALAEGFRFIGIERDAEYMEIAKRRIAHALKETT